MRLHLIVLLLIAPFFITAQEQPTAFTLEDAVNYALKHNYSAINADRDILDAQKQKWEVIASGLPQITGAVGYQNQIIQPIAQFPSILVPPEFLPEGVVQDPDTFIPIVFGPPQTATASATLRQQIFDGSYIVGVQATKSFLSYSRNNKEKTALEVRKAVVEAYGNVLLARESVAIFQKNKTNLEKNLVETQKIFENGLGDEESVDQLQITLASVDNQLKNAIRLEKITLQMLNLMMGLDTENPTTLLDNLTSLTEQNMDSNFLTQAFQIDNNIDYKLALNLNEQRFYELKLAKSRALPTLNGFLSYGANSFSDRFNFLSPGQQWFEQSILGLDLSIPIFSSLGRSASTQRAKIALEKAKTQLTEAEQQIRLQLDRAKSDYTFSIEQYQTSKENLALAERIETKNEIKYNEGLATSFELRQAQTQLYNSQQEYLQSMVDVINRRTQLEVILNQ